MRTTFLFLFIIIILSFYFPHKSTAQSPLTIESNTVVSTSTQSPFWIQSNRHGEYSSRGNQIFTKAAYHDLIEITNDINLLYGADLISRPGTQSTLSFNQGYLKIQGYGLEIAGGRFHNTSPINDDLLGMGSLGVSTNATPIPQIRIGLKDWTLIPFTNEFIEIKGHIAHGWLGSRRFTDNVLVHEKVGHMRFGGSLPVNFYGGLAHYVKWGGDHPVEGDIPTRLTDFFNVFFALGGDEFTPGQEQAFILGDHLGAWDFGFFIELNEADIKIYRQMPIETKDNVKFKSLQDALTGISFNFSENSRIPLNRFVYEFLYTMYQDGPRRPNIVNGLNCVENPGTCRDDYMGNENYYNHGLYRTGWAYNTRGIANPLFTVSEENLGIVNNRIIAHHMGFQSVFGGTTFTGKATFSRNYGKRCDNRIPDLGENELFGVECENIVDTTIERSLDQWSFLLGANIPLQTEQNISLMVELAFDNGRLAVNQFGGLLGIQWKPLQ